MTREVKVDRRPALRRARLLLAAALLVVAAVPSLSQAGEQRAMHEPLRETKPWPAPTGHRQPQAADVLQGLNNDDDQLYAALDRKLRICRGC
jgi:hypothetical protein